MVLVRDLSLSNLIYKDSEDCSFTGPGMPIVLSKDFLVLRYDNFI